MHFITKLSIAAIGLLAIAPQITVAENIEIKFRRFSLDTCPGDHIIQKDVNLDNDKCKTFDKHEPPFHSFMVTKINKGPNYLDDHLCQFIAHEDNDCKGQGFSGYDMKDHIDQCVTIKGFGARSVYFSCKPRSYPIATSPLPIKPTTSTATVFAGFDEVHTVTHYGTMTSHSIETMTIHTTLPTVTVTNSAPVSTPSVTKTVSLMPVDDCCCHGYGGDSDISSYPAPKDYYIPDEDIEHWV
ncbi:hypothetical protein LTR78_008175 [Recurvomyces mirabilis]|uniref:Uncharacterized protein n=1 Tax=Recurvomyces mirabilis TaxID=574656 RepID=A0AAE0WJ31_9PEZI|nr:hypothetical protein LTR78_008175 [Recurvomyces mirabilis]KAK5150626.1 hypothetical protein LTS14_009909 [Recurvomyces mirabilis]